MPYIIPVDVDGTNLSSAIKLQELYNKLSNSGAKRVTVFLDACFSGGARNMPLLAARSVRIVPKDERLNGNLVVFSATTAEQSAMSYKKEKHGMFTYFLLKKLQENKGDISYEEMKNYLHESVSIESVRINHKEQDPELHYSSSIANTWKNWKFYE